MKPLFTPEGEATLADAMRRRPLLAFDFDGTLAPIVPRAEDARIPRPVALRLQRLAQQLPVAIISGRRISDLRARLDFAPWRLVGNHGAEVEGSAGSEAATCALDPARRLIGDRSEPLLAAGVAVEDKGLSIALHYRRSRDRAAARSAIAAALAELPPELKVFGGHMVANVVAAWADDKARALAALVAERGAPDAVFVGDDVNDEPVFARGEPRWLTVRVGRSDPNSRARYVIGGHADMPRMLDLMGRALEGPL